jgi:hypothetical protein
MVRQFKPVPRRRKTRFSDGFRSTDQLVGLKGYESVRLWTNGTLTMGVDYSRYEARQTGIYQLSYPPVSRYGGHGNRLLRLISTVLFQQASLQADFGGITIVYMGTFLFPAAVCWNLLLRPPGKYPAEKIRSPVIRELFLWNHMRHFSLNG